MKTATHPEKLRSIHGAVAMAVRVLKTNSGYREASGRILRLDQIAVLRADGSVWLTELFVPQGEQTLSFRCAAWELSRQLRGLVKNGGWKRVECSSSAAV